MANDSYSQQALAADKNFQTRVRAAMAAVAWEVSGEDPNTPNHEARKKYARTVIDNLQNIAAQVAPWLVQRPNVNSFATSYNFQAGAVVTASGDADILSQIHTDWDFLSSNYIP